MKSCSRCSRKSSATPPVVDATAARGSAQIQLHPFLGASRAPCERLTVIGADEADPFIQAYSGVVTIEYPQKGSSHPRGLQAVNDDGEHTESNARTSAFG